ncbi:MAG: hypothetical protein AAF514_08685 [Verrucomicrobiota bacterium]
MKAALLPRLESLANEWGHTAAAGRGILWIRRIWWVWTAFLAYLLVNPWLRYAEIYAQVPGPNWRYVMHREYLPLLVASHWAIPTVLAFWLLTRLVARIRRAPRLRRQEPNGEEPPISLWWKAGLAMLAFAAASHLFFTVLFFRDGVFLLKVRDEKSGMSTVEIHSEGLGMLTRFEPLNRDMALGDTYRYLQRRSKSPNVLPFYQPWLILLLTLSYVWMGLLLVGKHRDHVRAALVWKAGP